MEGGDSVGPVVLRFSAQSVALYRERRKCSRVLNLVTSSNFDDY